MGTTDLQVITIIYLPEQSYRLLCVERFRRDITTSECFTEVLQAMKDDPERLTAVVEMAHNVRNKVFSNGKLKRVRLFLSCDLIRLVNDISRKEYLLRDLIISQAFWIYIQKRKEQDVL
jgi:hypothetical protein